MGEYTIRFPYLSMFIQLKNPNTTNGRRGLLPLHSILCFSMRHLSLGDRIVSFFFRLLVILNFWVLSYCQMVRIGPLHLTLDFHLTMTAFRDSYPSISSLSPLPS